MRGSRRGRFSLPIQVSSSRFSRFVIPSFLASCARSVAQRPAQREDGFDARFRLELALDLRDELGALLVDVVLRVEELSPLGRSSLFERLDDPLLFQLLGERDRRLRGLARGADLSVELRQLLLE